jgi:hypothetical protein
MNEYTASNGVRVVKGFDSGTWFTIDMSTVDNTVKLAGVHVDALREFFRAEEDERLGRWRWPENEGYIVYPDARYPHLVAVIDESTGMREVRSKSKAGHKRDNFERAAAAYFDAHPEPKPWHNAGADEAWELTVNGDTGPFVTVLKPSGAYHFRAGNGTEVIAESVQITAGRRIYPEGDA